MLLQCYCTELQLVRIKTVSQDEYFCNYGHNILGVYEVLVKVWSATSETERDI